MNVYTVSAVDNDNDKFRALMYDKSKSDFTGLELGGTPKMADWMPPPVYVYRPRMKYGDFWHYWGGASTIAVAPRARDAVGAMLAAEDELLPFDVGGETFHFINIVGLTDCFDVDGSVWMDPEWKHTILEYSFQPDKVGRSLFKVPKFSSSRLFAAVVTRDPATEFKAMVESRNLTGIFFKEVWSNES